MHTRTAMNIFNNISILVLVPVFQTYFFPWLKKLRGKDLTMLEKIGLGFIFATLAMLVAGLVELYRTQNDTRKHQEKFKEVMNDVSNMASIMPTIKPNTAWDLHLDRTLDMFHSIKTYDIFEQQLIIIINSLHDIDRETDTDIATALEKKISKICKICSHLKDRSKEKNWIRIYAWYRYVNKN